MKGGAVYASFTHLFVQPNPRESMMHPNALICCLRSSSHMSLSYVFQICGYDSPCSSVCPVRLLDLQ